MRVHACVDPVLGRASPAGIDDLAQNSGWGGVGSDHDTATFAVASIRRWWEGMGRTVSPHATRLLICADGGGRGGSRVRLWKLELGRLADATGLALQVCHLPAGTSTWHTIEHRLVSVISQNWRGRPSLSDAVIVRRSAATTTAAGLRLQRTLDTNRSPTGRTVSADELATVRLARDAFHGAWNYTILPATLPD